MSLIENEIFEILKVFEKSDFNELHLEMPGLKLSVGRGTHQVLAQNKVHLNTELRPASAHDEEKPMGHRSVDRSNSGTPIATDDRQKVAPSTEPVSFDEEGLIPIKSPLLGIFYRSQKPGAPPFVEVGQYVTENDTVCLLEVMKLFSAVKAGVSGRITRVCVENTQVVEHNQTLFLVEPEIESPEEKEGP